MNRKGYVSLEVIVIAGLILAAGIVLLMRFVERADEAGEAAHDEFEDALEGAQGDLPGSEPE